MAPVLVLATGLSAATTWLAVGRLGGLTTAGRLATIVGAIAIVSGWAAAMAARPLLRRVLRQRPIEDFPPETGQGAKLLSNIIESVEASVMTISSSGTITSFSAVAESTLGHAAQDVVGRHFGSVFPNVPANLAVRDMIISALTAHRTYSSEEVQAVTAEGETVLLGVTVSLLRDAAGRTRGIVLTFKNLADVHRLREQVQRTRQLAELGGLAAGMAHEIRNPLGSVHGFVELIQEDMEEDDPRRAYTATILRTVGQLNSLVEDLLEFSQPPVARWEGLDVRDLAHEALQLCLPDEKEARLSVAEQHAPEPLPVFADRTSLVRALVNIVRNAFQATPDGGRVVVSAGPLPSTSADGTGRVAIAVHNTGSYVAPEARHRLFTPFFTTKSGGTGLGLPIANQIVSAHEGQIEVESDPDGGTTFRVVLPGGPAAEPAGLVATVAAEGRGA